jgi:hypothetical protein
MQLSINNNLTSYQFLLPEPPKYPQPPPFYFEFEVDYTICIKLNYDKIANREIISNENLILQISIVVLIIIVLLILVILLLKCVYRQLKNDLFYDSKSMDTIPTQNVCKNVYMIPLDFKGSTTRLIRHSTSPNIYYTISTTQHNNNNRRNFPRTNPRFFSPN